MPTQLQIDLNMVHSQIWAQFDLKHFVFKLLYYCIIYLAMYLSIQVVGTPAHTTIFIGKKKLQ